MTRKLRLLLIALACATTPAVHAHSVWIEPGGRDELVIRFAEPGNKFERSPGHLDGLSAPLAFTVVSNAPASIEASKKTNHFLLVGASSTNMAGAETSFTVRGGRKPLFYARWQPVGAGPTPPLLTLDLVPTGRAGEVRVFFRGRPLGGVKATLRAPDEKESEITADGEGFLRFESKQAGQYLLTIAHHREPLAGFHNGVAYRETSHNCSMVWRQVP